MIFAPNLLSLAIALDMETTIPEEKRKEFQDRLNEILENGTDEDLFEWADEVDKFN